MDINDQTNFHPVNDDVPMTAGDENKISKHVTKHYRKYLFGIGAFCGFIVSLILRLSFGTSATTITTKAGYETPATIGNAALVIFDQMDQIAHAKDSFFHKKGGIYTFDDDTIFKKYDTIFHVLDNGYHRSFNADEKLKRADKLQRFFKMQDALFASTRYGDSSQDMLFKQLDASFTQALTGINIKDFSGIDIKGLNIDEILNIDETPIEMDQTSTGTENIDTGVQKTQ